MYQLPQHHIERIAADHHAGLIRAGEQRRQAAAAPGPRPESDPVIVSPQRGRRRARRVAVVAFAAAVGMGAGFAVADQPDRAPTSPSDSLVVSSHLRAM